MLLNEIKRPPLEVRPTNDPARFYPGGKNRGRFQFVGQGAGGGMGHGEAFDSRVFLDKKHPNQIVKVVPIWNTNDSYLKYIQMVKQHQNNPFFPRIYGIRLYEEPADQVEDMNGNMVDVPEHLMLHVWMERLHPITTLDPEHAYQLLSDIGVDYRGRLKNDLSMRALFSPLFRQWSRMHSLHPKFKEAMRLLEPMFKRFEHDMHIENVMIRLTGVGPQLVIVDPLWPSFGDD